MTERLLLFALCYLAIKSFRGVQHSTTCRGFQFFALFASFVILFFGTLSIFSKAKTSISSSAYSTGYDSGFEDGYDEGYNDGSDSASDMFNDERVEAGAILKEFLYCPKLINLVFSRCDDPIDYLYSTYEPIWGNLTRYEGDLTLSELSPKQQLLVNYPRLFKNYIYCVDAGKKTYHSIPDCYMLLKTPLENIKVSTLQDAKQNGYEPCSRCVDPNIEK